MNLLPYSSLNKNFEVIICGPENPYFYGKVLVEIAHYHPLGFVRESVHEVVHKHVLCAHPRVIQQHIADIINDHHAHSHVGLGGE